MYTVSVTAEGVFTTTLSPEAVEFLDSCKVDTGRNRLRRHGYFENKTLQGLEKEVRATFEEAFSRELVETKVVIYYVIETACHYCLDVDGEVVPNGYWIKDRDDSMGCLWEDGTKNDPFRRAGPFGLQVYVSPRIKNTYRYRSGASKEESARVSDTDAGEQLLKDDFYLRWLNDIVKMSAPDHADIQELDYTPEIGKFFVGLVKGIFQLNERIKDFVTPKAIAEMAASGVNLLMAPGKK